MRPPELAPQRKMEMDVPVRRGVTLAEQLAASSNLRDLLKLPDDDDDDGRVAAAGRRRSTLLDAIRGADDDRAPAVLPSATAASRERVSLMALLERTEQQWTAEQWKKRVEGEEEEEEDQESEEKGVGGRCCVCVARGKGAAFIPCGHTFCRACARDLSAARGRCPLCNAAIRDVLNLF